jgi:hypothetical protein
MAGLPAGMPLGDARLVRTRPAASRHTPGCSWPARCSARRPAARRADAPTSRAAARDRPVLGRLPRRVRRCSTCSGWAPRSGLRTAAVELDAGRAVPARRRAAARPAVVAFVLLVTFVGSLIHVYSLGYMEHDPDKRRFFAYLNLFVAAMLLLVLADSYLLVYVGWEGVGLASYLLIGFWNWNPPYASAANKAFVANRVGDLGMGLAIMAMFWQFGRSTSRRSTLAWPPGRQPGRPHRDRPVPAAGRLRQVGPVPAAELARRRDGRPDPGVGADPRGDDGHRRRLPRRAQPRDLRRRPQRADWPSSSSARSPCSTGRSSAAPRTTSRRPSPPRR